MSEGVRKLEFAKRFQWMIRLSWSNTKRDDPTVIPKLLRRFGAHFKLKWTQTDLRTSWCQLGWAFCLVFSVGAERGKK